jgi:hypothetical protein
MSASTFNLWLTVIGTACWVVCFGWMHRISARQNRLLDRLAEQAARIEHFSKAEHDLIREVHPQVGEIREGLEEVIAVVKEKTEANPAATPVRRRPT